MRAALVLMVCVCQSAVGKLTPLAEPPDWSRLDAYQGTIAREDFVGKLESVYAPGGASAAVIRVGEGSAMIETGAGRPPFELRFAATREGAEPAPRYWRPRDSLPAPPSGKPLAGVRIALDPGHLGGKWAKMEERWFQVGDTKPVTEGDMTLLVAKLLAERLRDMGAEVLFTRTKPGPVTAARPETLGKAAAAALAERGAPVNPISLRRERERLFYRVSEIRRRAELVNETLCPDLVVCLHFNAEDWGSESRPRLVEENHLHFLVTGGWSAEELAYEDQRFDMLAKLLGRTLPEEIAVSAAMAPVMARETGLPPYTYRQSNATPIADNPYAWARNLLANRLFRCPVVYVEPYVMNSKAAFARIQAGDYDGRRTFGGVERKSIYREYADAVAEGLAAYYGRR